MPTKKRVVVVHPQRGHLAPAFTDDELRERELASLVVELKSSIYSSSVDEQEEGEWAELVSSYVPSDLEKAAAPLAEEAIGLDLIESSSFDEPNAPVELGVTAQGEETLLLIGVMNGLKSWKKAPKPEVIAQAVTLAIARVRGTSDLKHPRDLAKEVKVRPQTLFKVLNLAESEIVRQGLTNALKKTGT